MGRERWSASEGMWTGMKFVVFLGDGMSDRPMAQLGGRTPLMAARTPHLDRMVREGVGGWSRNTPPGYYPGSDVANLGVLGYDVTRGYTGRSPLEAAAMGVNLGLSDIAFRCNLVSLSPDFSLMDDYSADQITSAEAALLIEALNRRFAGSPFRFHPGVGYRHLMVWSGGLEGMTCIPPHDFSGKPVQAHLPQGEGAETLMELTRASWEVLDNHEVNHQRVQKGGKPANSIWLWGQGRRPELQPFRERFGLSGGMISAVDLMRGIATHIGFEVIHVPGATGWIDTNYAGKAQACLDGLKRHDLIFVHVESPDEAGHAGRLDYKIQAIEDFDAKVVGAVLEGLEARGEAFRALALPDHPTPVEMRTHTYEVVPFAMMGQGIVPDGNDRYDENLLQVGSLGVDPGHDLMRRFLTV